MSAAELIASKPNVLMDFDGPICSVFSGFTNRAVATELRKRIGLHSAAPTSTDPFDVLRSAAGDHRDAEMAERELARLEVEAVTTAAPTSGAFDVLKGLARGGWRIVIVSNNSDTAVEAFLTRHDLGDYVAAVSARIDPDPQLLKPHPHLINRAFELAGSAADRCVLIGDSIADLEAARASGVAFIAFANKPGKREAFEHRRVDAVIERMTELQLQGTD